MTILGSSLFFSNFDTPMDTLPLRIWRLSLLPYDGVQMQGWGAALVLILIIIGINIGVRILVLNKDDTYCFGRMIKEKIDRRK